MIRIDRHPNYEKNKEASEKYLEEQDKNGNVKVLPNTYENIRFHRGSEKVIKLQRRYVDLYLQSLNGLINDHLFPLLNRGFGLQGIYRLEEGNALPASFTNKRTIEDSIIEWSDNKKLPENYVHRNTFAINNTYYPYTFSARTVPGKYKNTVYEIFANQKRKEELNKFFQGNIEIEYNPGFIDGERKFKLIHYRSDSERHNSREIRFNFATKEFKIESYNLQNKCESPFYKSFYRDHSFNYELSEEDGSLPFLTFEEFRNKIVQPSIRLIGSINKGMDAFDKERKDKWERFNEDAHGKAMKDSNKKGKNFVVGNIFHGTYEES